MNSATGPVDVWDRSTLCCLWLFEAELTAKLKQMLTYMISISSHAESQNRAIGMHAVLV